MLLAGTDTELLDLDGGTQLVVGRVTALAGRGPDIVVLLDGRRVARVDRSGSQVLGQLAAADGQSLVVLPGGDPVVGLRGGRLARLRAGRFEPLPAFEDVPGRHDWGNPAGPEPDTRSMDVDPRGRLWVNVHVGGVWSSDDEGVTWRGAVEPPADVHEVVADGEGRVAVAAAIGFGWSTDGGATWAWSTDGLHGSYLRGVALDGDAVVVSASTGPFTRQGAVYRAALGHRFERCQQGLPEWFPGNVDTGCLAASGGRVALGTHDGTVYASDDDGVTWDIAAKGLEPVRAVELR